MTYLLSRYKVKQLKAGGFLRLFTSVFTKESNYNPHFCKEINSSMGIFNNYKEIKTLSLPRVHTAAVIDS